jgi:molybdate transport system substrate-binding protein
MTAFSYLALLLLLIPASAFAEKITLAAAASVRSAMEEMIAAYNVLHPGVGIETVFGASGKLSTQIQNGAPYDLFFSADLELPQKLKSAGFAASEPTVYAIGRLVLWSANENASKLTLKNLTEERFRRIAIAQPNHAPYGMRAREAMQAEGIWDAVQGKLVFGESITHAAQMAQSGAADIAVIALSMVSNQALSTQGYLLISDTLHQPLAQAFVITRHGANKPATRQFADYVTSDAAHVVLAKHGFARPLAFNQ